MRRLRAWMVRLASVLRPARRERELDDELRAHLDLHVADNLRAGMTPADARRRAVLAIGGIEPTKERARDRMGLPWLEALLRDVRFGVRSLRRSPAFTTAAVLTLGLGIGALATIVTAVDTVLWQPLPYPDAGRIVQVWERTADDSLILPSDPNFTDLRDQNRTFASLAQYGRGRRAVTVESEALLPMVAAVSAGFFETIGVVPDRGRGFTAEERAFGTAPVAVVSDGFWRQQLGGRTRISDVPIRIDDRPVTVVGVMPPGFGFPENADVWLSREQWQERPSGRTGRNARAIGRLAPGASIERAQQDLSVLARRLETQHRGDTVMTDATVIGLQDELVGDVRPVLLALLGGVAFLLLVAVANVLNLWLSRAASREREGALRQALGSGWWRLAQQAVVEGLLLSAAGGALGLVFAWWATRAFRELAPADLPRIEELAIGSPVVAIAAAVSVIVGLALGLGGFARGMATRTQTALRQEPGTARPVSSQRAGATLVVAQLAVTLVLLVGAALIGRSMLGLLNTDAGVRTTDVLTVALFQPSVDATSPFDPVGTADPQKLERARRLELAAARLQALPGALEVGLTSGVPMGGNFGNGTFLILDAPDEVLDFDTFGRLANDPARAGSAAYRAVSEGYFAALDIPLVRGRLFDDRDAIDAPHVAVISQALADARWPDINPVGALLQFGNMDGDLRALTVVGVVGDVRDYGLDRPAARVIYTNYRQRPHMVSALVAHTGVQAETLLVPARNAVRAALPGVPTVEETVAARVANWLRWRRFTLQMLVFFATIAILVSVAGIHGALSYAVTQQRRAIGIRLALGAEPRGILAMILRRGAALAAAGVACGVVIALWSTRALTTLLYEVTPADPATYALAAAGLVGTVLLVSWLPARRAALVDPVVTLRAD